MYRSIMVPFVDWRADHTALKLAVQLARQSGGELHVVQVRRDTVNADALRAEEEALAAAVDWARGELGDAVSFQLIRTAVRDQRAARAAHALADYANENHVELTVMTRVPRSSARVLFGNVGEYLISLLDAPILFVPGGYPQLSLKHCRVLVPLDGSPGAESILPEAAALAGLMGGSMTLMRVVEPRVPDERPSFEDLLTGYGVEREAGAHDYLSAIAGQLHAAGTSVQTITLVGDRVSMLQRAATVEHIDVIALATRPRASHLTFIAESLTARLLLSFDTALLVRQQAARTVEDWQALARVG